MVAGDAGRGTHELHRCEVPPLTHVGLDEVSVLLHGPEHLTALEGLLDARGSLVGEVHAARLAVPTALLERLPCQKLTLAGRVHIGRDADLVHPGKLPLQLRDDIGAALEHALLPSELSEVPGQPFQRPFLHGFGLPGRHLLVGREQAHDMTSKGADFILHAGIGAGGPAERLCEVALSTRLLCEYENHCGSFHGRGG